MVRRRRLAAEVAKRLLIERASRAAVPMSAEAPHEQLALFVRGGHLFGVPLSFLRFAWRADGLLEVPGAPNFIVGAIPGDGSLVTVVDLPLLYGIVIPGVADLRTVLITDLGGRRLGIASESVLGAQPVPSASFRPAPNPYGAVTRIALWKERTVQVVDVPALLRDPKVNANRGAHA
jgi:chemotaxis signal transduction protein